MAQKQKSGGGAKKIGRNKMSCQQYYNEHRREKAKIKNFIKHNIPKDGTEELRKKLINEFKELQDKRNKK